MQRRSEEPEASAGPSHGTSCDGNPPHRVTTDQLTEAEQRLRMALRAGNTGTWDWDIVNNRVTWSEQIYAFHGLRPGEFGGRVEDFGPLIVPEDRQRVTDAVRRAVEEGAPYHVEYRAPLPDGRVRWILTTGEVFRGPDGRPVRMMGAASDITDRKLAEQAALDAERRYRAIFEATRDGLIINAADGAIIEANPAACRMHGYTYEQFLKLRPDQFIHPDDLPLFADFVCVTAGGGEFRCRARDVRSDGTVFPVEVLGTSFQYNGGPHILGVVRDVTERARTHERLERLYAVAAALSEAPAPDDVARVAVEQGIDALGASAGALLLLSADGQSLEMAGHTGYPADMMEPWMRCPMDAPVPLTDAVRRAEPIFLETPEERVRRYPALAGVRARSQTQSSACVPLVVGGKAVGVLGLSFDRPGAFSQEDRQFMLSLARQCAQALERARLYDAERRARAEAERASRAKDEFIAVLSHELRTPLTPVLLTVSLMESHPDLPPELREDVATIRRNVELESRLISDLLDLTRIARGKMQLDVQKVDAHLLLRAAIDICQREGSAHLVTDLAATRHLVDGDSARLQQVFWNLINNAQKFTGPEGTITVRSADAPGGRMRVEVADTGVGIDPAILPKLFTAFEQGDLRTTRQFGGLGLGLAISRQLVELHGGAITASSAGKGLGATFAVELPTVEAFVPSAPDSPPRALPPAAGVAPLRVLLVEDHEPTMRVLRRLLEQMGHRVVPAASLATARAAARAGEFDLLLSDLGLHDGSGLQLMQEMGDRFAGRAIALTGYGMEEDVRNSAAAGFAAHLTKPVDFQRLEESIRQVTAHA
jgi:PAS domain S-box-containing protein